MDDSVNRLLALGRALDDVRFASALLTGRLDPGAWRGPARRAFDEAGRELPELVRAAEAALERERQRSLLARDSGE